MIPGLFNSRPSRSLRLALGGLQQRQQTIANNVANVDTPGYRARTVQFEAALQAELKGRAADPRLLRIGLSRTNDRHIPVSPIVETPGATIQNLESTDGTLRADGNTVDVEREMSKLAETQLLYSALAQVQSQSFGHLRTAINEGRR